MHADALRYVSFLKDLTSTELEAFAALATERTAEKGDEIVSEGKPVTALYIVSKGSAHVRRTTKGTEVLLGRIAPGGFFGEINLFDPGVATATVVAVGHVELAAIGHETLRSFMAENPATGYKVASALLGEVCKRMRQTNERFVNAVYWASAESRESAPDSGD